MPVLLPGMMQQCQRLKLSVNAIRNLISVYKATLFEKVQKLGLSIKDWEIVILLVYRRHGHKLGIGKKQQNFDLKKL